MNAYEQLREHVFALEIFDTHEHLPAFEGKRNQKNDVLAEYLIHYFSCDLVSAGLTLPDLETARNVEKPLANRWRLVEPFWDAARGTGYGRSLDIAVRELYGLPRIDRATIEPLNQAFLAARAAGGVYRRVLKDKARIKLSVLDSGTTDCDREFFRPAVRLDDFITAATPADLANLAKRAGAPDIHSLTDLEDAAEKMVDEAFAQGACCLKSGLAYARRLRYEKVARAAAEEEFAGIRQQRNWTRPAGGSAAGWPKLQDYMMHHVCRLADRRGLTFEIHTGLQEGNGNYIDHAEPAQLTNLFLEYRQVRFDIFHIGYPYEHTLSALAKNFANVYIDFAWAHIISPMAATAALAEYLDAVPANKISAFGGDYCFVDAVLGHAWLARENVARALALKVEQGAMDLDRALTVATMVLHDNPRRIFGLDEKRSPRRSRKAAGRKKRKA